MQEHYREIRGTGRALIGPLHFRKFKEVTVHFRGCTEVLNRVLEVSKGTVGVAASHNTVRNFHSEFDSRPRMFS